MRNVTTLSKAFELIGRRQQELSETDASFIVSEMRYHVNGEYTDEELHDSEWYDLSFECFELIDQFHQGLGATLGPIIEHELSVCAAAGNCYHEYLRWLLEAIRKIRITGEGINNSIPKLLNHPNKGVRLTAAECIADMEGVPDELAIALGVFLADHLFSIRWAAATRVASFADKRISRQLLNAQLRREPSLINKWHIAALLLFKRLKDFATA